MQRDWIFLINTFYVHTHKSHKNALTLFEDSYAKLLAESVHDTEIAIILQEFEPAYKGFKELYALKQANVGIYRGETLQFEQTLEEMTEQLRRWEALIRVVFLEDSTEEHSIFPNKRQSFFKGTYEQRISAVKSLSITLERYPQLTHVKYLVETYYNRLEGNRLTQQQQEGTKNNIGSLLNKQHLIACQELYGVLARLMYKFRYEPQRVSNFIDISLVRIKTKSTTAAVLQGSVRNSQNEIITNALVQLLDTDYQTLTDEAGNFELSAKTGKFNLSVISQAHNYAATMSIKLKRGKNPTMIIVL